MLVPAMPLGIVDEVDVAVDETATLPEPEPHIPDVFRVPVVIELPELADIPDVAAAAGVAPPTANPPPS